MAVVIDGTTGIATPGEAVSGNISYTGTLTGGTGVVDLGSGQFYKDASGNVGIGTTPYVKLQVTGTIKVATGNAQGILSLGDGGGASVNCGVWRGAANAPTTDGNYLNFGGYDGLVFATGNAAIGSQTERARIDTSGNLLVGTTSGSNKVTVSGAVYASGTFISGNATPVTAASVGSNPGTAAIWDGSGNLYKQSSSMRYKENIADWTVTDAELDAFVNLSPKLWDYTGKQNGCAGFIAEDIEALGLKNAYNVSPLINYSNEGEPDSNRDFALIALQHKVIQRLEKSLQEQQTIIVSLQDTLTALNERLTALEAPIV